MNSEKKKIESRQHNTKTKERKSPSFVFFFYILVGSRFDLLLCCCSRTYFWLTTDPRTAVGIKTAPIAIAPKKLKSKTKVPLVHRVVRPCYGRFKYRSNEATIAIFVG